MVQRNDFCPCGSGKRFKHCHGRLALESMKGNNNTYFYATSMQVDVGAIVQPGNWGNILYAYKNPSENDLKKLIIEQTLENIRLQLFPHKPRRMKSIFLFENLEQTRDFTKNYKRPADSIFEVRILDPSKPIHKGSMKAYDLPKKTLPFLSTLEQIATIYWEGKQLEYPEIVVESSVEILKKHE